MIYRYLQSLYHLNHDSKLFIFRQINRMPDYYRFGVNVLCLIFYALSLSPKILKTFDKLISSLHLVKKNEKVL